MLTGKHWKYPKNDDLVLSSLRGLAAANPSIRVIPSEKVVYRPLQSKKVAIISGGGAGHEPLHLGFVGSNLLDAAVSGAIFASPSTKQIMAAVKATADKQTGAVVVVKNYTGDVLHFGLVAEKAKAAGYAVELVVVGDDVAVGRAQNAMVGRRGLAATALVHKVVGAAAAAGGALADVAELGRAVAAVSATMSASLDRTSVPGRDGESAELTGAGKAELGLGIHNEPGHKIDIPEIAELIDTLYARILDDRDEDRHYLDVSEKDEVVLVVNNLGGTSSLELFAIAHYAVERCPLLQRPARVLVSDFVTSLSSPGFSLSVLNVTKAATGKFGAADVFGFLDAETDAPGWKPKTYSASLWDKRSEEDASPEEHVSVLRSSLKVDGKWFGGALSAGLENVIEKEPLITEYDTKVGDGDCGETLKSGASAILHSLARDADFKNDISDPVATITRITDLVEDNMGGTSGGIYAIFLTALAKSLKQQGAADSAGVAAALKSALYDGLFKYTKARVGDRTLVDTLQPFVDELSKSGNLQAAVDAAKKGCDATGDLEARFGRSSYVSKDDAAHIPDPGAVGLLAIIEGFAGYAN